MPSTMRITTPELDKMKAVHEQSQKIGEFLEWLTQTEGVVLAEYAEDRDEEDDPNRLYHSDKSIESLLAKFYGIDLKKCEQEKRAILEELQRQNEARKP